MSTIALITGGFDPLHSGHISLIKSASQMSLLVAIGLNSDAWLYRKKGYVHMPFTERKEILESIQEVHKVFGFSDADDTACRAIQKVAWIYDRPVERIIFCNGGDRTEDNIPEMGFQPIAGRPEDEDPILEFAFGVGGTDKKNSSSELVKAQRDWGYWHVLKDNGTTKVKELVIMPGKELSYQRHFKRSEFWLVSEGECTVRQGYENSDYDTEKILEYHQHLHIPIGVWHNIKNHTDKVCKILEIQYGTECVEEDIERDK